MNMWRLLHLLLALGLTTALYGQAGFVYYDVDHLYDTLPSPFYNDDHYTPAGRYGWDGPRYRRKVADVAALIDSMAQPVVALYGVENEQVVRDIVTATRGDYTYLHRTLNSLDGMDFALLYYGDRLHPLHCHTARRTLCIEATLDRDSVLILLSADRATLGATLTELRERHPRHRRIVAGPLQGFDGTIYGLTDRMAQAVARGYGNRRRNHTWQMRDRILTEQHDATPAGEVYIRRFLVDSYTGEPVPTYSGNRYRGGRGRNLPIRCRINR